jgi:H/ACA ribonucleoprotein complex subunit 4
MGKELLEFGIINVDKPAGMTSFDVVDEIRKTFKLRKVSHFGTLDPMVTGVLPIALNRACKLTGFFIRHDKEYIGEMKIHEDIELDKIKKMVKEKFLGKIIQLPPVKSRVKRQEREREIMKFDLLEKKEMIIKFHTEVEGGTYIRKLIHDLGQALGINAQMSKLRRIRAGIFEEKDSVKLDDLEKMKGKELEKVIIPAEEAITQIYPVVQIKENNLKQIFTGKPIHKNDLVKKQKREQKEIVCVFSGERFVGMYEVINEGEVFAKAKFVLQPMK